MRQAIDQHNYIVVTDTEGFIKDVNDKFMQRAGYRKEELIGRSMRIFKSGLHTKEFYKDMWDTIKSGRVWNGVIANMSKNGEIYWINATIVPVVGPNNEIVEFISIRTDITEIRHLQDALEKSIKREQSIGFEIQQALLYGPAPAIKNVQISAFTEASMGVDGDFYAIQVLNEQKFDIAIGDVMGKGTAAALIAAATKQKISNALAERYLHGNIPSVEDVTNYVQQHMVDKLIQLERFLTLFYCRVDLDAMVINYIDCGHGLAMHAKADGVQLVRGDNLPLGVIDSDPLKMHASQLDEGDIILLYSDGVTDATNVDGARFCDTNLLNMVSESYMHDIPACILTNLIEQQVRNFEAGHPVVDDRTIIAIRIEKSRPSLHAIDLGWSVDGLNLVRQAVQALAEKAGMRVEKCESLILAAVESFTNILRHAKKPSTAAAIHCRIESLINTIRVDFYYVGEPFFPEDGLPDFSEEAEGGFGLYIVRNSVDVVEYSSPIPGVCLTRMLQEID